MSNLKRKKLIHVVSWIVLLMSFYHGHAEEQKHYLRSDYYRELVGFSNMSYLLKYNNKNVYKAESDWTILGTIRLLMTGFRRSMQILEKLVLYNQIKSDPPLPITSVYTNSIDFRVGRGINVNYNNDQIQLNSAATPFEFIWVSKTGMGTVVKIDTNTGDILGEYRTNPDIYGLGSPWATSVDHDGSVWLANLHNVDEVYGSVIHIGLKENNQCEDRNNNGVIDTSSGLGDIKAWTIPDINTADDECIIHYVKTPQNPGHISVNNDNDIWVGFLGQGFVLVKGGGPTVHGAGTIIRSEWSVNFGGHGGLTSGDIIWSGSPLLRWNTSRPLDGENGDPSGLDIGPPVNDRNWAGKKDFSSPAFCMDKEGNIWNTDFSKKDSIVKYDKDGLFLDQYIHGFSNGQGCVVDAREGGTNDVWIAQLWRGDSCSVGHLKNDGTIVGTVNLGCNKGATTGVAVDGKGKIWAINYHYQTVSRIDPTLGDFVGSNNVGAVDLTVPLGGSANHWEYGDMTGSTLRSAPTTGNWRVTIDRNNTIFDWTSTTISWNAVVPFGTTLTVTASSSNDGTFFTAPTSVVNGSQLNSSTIAGGRYLQIQILLRRNNRSTAASPIIYDLKAASTMA